MERRREYTHPGWRHLEGHGWAYLHAGGAIGADGSVPDVSVSLRGPLARLALPDPPMGDDLKGAVHATLRTLDVAPDGITVPLVGLVFRAVLNEAAPADFAGHLVGPTGTRKSELAALTQQHFGPSFDRLHLPAAWAATANALERTVFDFKDALAVIDDFAPTGSPYDVARYHAAADRVLRGTGNAAGRARMAADGGRRPDYPPRGLVLSTGEDVPRGQSLRARTVVLEVAPGDVELERLTELQTLGRNGVFVRVTAAYVRWLAPQLDELRDRFLDDIADLRAQAHRTGMHGRTPEATANLALGWRFWLAFAQDEGALTAAEAAHTWLRVWAALLGVAARQADHQAVEDPPRRFLELLAAAIASGQAHVAAPSGGAPSESQGWGWRERTVGTGEYERTEGVPQGLQVGWLDGDDLYLEPDAAYAAAQRVGQATGTALTVHPRTLVKRLHERGLLRGTEQRVGTLTVRRTVAGQRRRVLYLAATALSPEEPGQAGQSGRQGTDGAEMPVALGANGQVSGPDSAVPREEPGQGNWPEPAPAGGDGHSGQVGQVQSAWVAEPAAFGTGAAGGRSCEEWHLAPVVPEETSSGNTGKAGIREAEEDRQGDVSRNPVFPDEAEPDLDGWDHWEESL